MLQEISRRKFMELTGAGALLLTSAGMMTGCCREYPTLFGQWIDMDDLRIRFSRACYIPAQDGTVFGCTVKIKAKDATQTITLKKDDFTMVVNGTELTENVLHGENVPGGGIQFNGDKDFLVYGYNADIKTNEQLNEIIKEFKMQVTFQHNGKRVSAVTVEGERLIVGGSGHS